MGCKKGTKIKVIKKSATGRNLLFQAEGTKTTMTRAELVKKIEKGNYKNYYVKNIHGMKTPVSKPDKTKNNNMG